MSDFSTCAEVTARVLRIKAWDSIFEIAQSRREVKRSDKSGKQAHYSWVAMPTKRGSGYDALVMGHAEGIAHFGCWCVIVEMAANCQPRGTLIRSSHGPAESPGYNAESLAIAARVPVSVMAEALRRLIGIGWLEVVPGTLGNYSEFAQPTGQDIQERTENLCASGDAHRESDSDSANKQKAEKDYKADEREAWFAEFWAVYLKIRNRDRKRALSAFKRAITNGETFAVVMAALKAQAPVLMHSETRHRPHATTWINGERWKDDIEVSSECERPLSFRERVSRTTPGGYGGNSASRKPIRNIQDDMPEVLSDEEKQA